MSLAEEKKVAARISTELGLVFADGKFSLDGWGQADKFAFVRDDFLVLLEVETGQKHPDTNVLKVWPYLEAHQGMVVVLIQVFDAVAQNEKGNRGRLASWVAEKMTAVVGDRFAYYRFIRGPEGLISGDFEGLRALIFRGALG